MAKSNKIVKNFSNYSKRQKKKQDKTEQKKSLNSLQIIVINVYQRNITLLKMGLLFFCASHSTK